MTQHCVSWRHVTCSVLIRCVSPTSDHFDFVSCFPISWFCSFNMINETLDVIHLQSGGPSLFTLYNVKGGVLGGDHAQYLQRTV